MIALGLAVPRGLEPPTFGLGNPWYEGPSDSLRWWPRNKCLQFRVSQANCLTGSCL